LPVYFDISDRVGFGCPNRRDDVMLVQYLLKKTYSVGALTLRQPVMPPGGVRVDGRFSYHDQYMILHYQFQQCYGGRGGFIDGIISPTHGNFTASAQVQYTIIYLNLGLLAFFPQVHDDPVSESDFPPQLLHVLEGRHR